MKEEQLYEEFFKKDEKKVDYKAIIFEYLYIGRLLLYSCCCLSFSLMCICAIKRQFTVLRLL